MRPWETATEKQLNFWIRDAAMLQWQGGDLNDFYESRHVHDNWSDDDSKTFLEQYSLEINKAENQLERWIDGEDI